MKPRNPMTGASIVLGVLLAVTLALPAGAVTVQGTLRYEKIPATLKGLDFAHPVQAPVGNVRVELRTPDQKQVLARSTTGADGSYRFQIADGTGQVVLVIPAESGGIQVVDPATRQIHGTATAAFDPARGPKSVLIPEKNRLSGPFNILATLRRVNTRLAEIDPTFPIDDLELVVYWSPTSRDTFYHTEENAVYIGGARDVNASESDDTVIVHEYGHYLAHHFSRDDTVSGEHGPGDRLDPRVAWSEGWATFIALATLGAPIYIDTYGPNGKRVFAWDMEEDAPDWDTPGYWSEHSVGAALWDICADADLSRDHLGLGLQPIWQAFRKYMPEQTWVYLITMADGLIEADRSRDDRVTAILAKYQIEYRFGVVPPVEVPFPRRISPGVPVTGTVDSSQSERYNLLDAADYYQFRIESSRNVEIELKVTDANASGAADLMLVLYNAQGEYLALVDNQHGVSSLERVTKKLRAGTYILGVWSFRWTGRTFLYDGADYRLTANF